MPGLGLVSGGGNCLLSIVPLLGVVVWVIGGPVLLAAFVLSIVAIAQGRATGGVLLLLFSVTLAPLAVFLGPILATFLLALFASPSA